MMGLLLGVVLVFCVDEIINFFLVKFCRNWVSHEVVQLSFRSEVMEKSFFFTCFIFICFEEKCSNLRNFVLTIKSRIQQKFTIFYNIPKLTYYLMYGLIVDSQYKI